MLCSGWLRSWHRFKGVPMRRGLAARAICSVVPLMVVPERLWKHNRI